MNILNDPMSATFLLPMEENGGGRYVMELDVRTALRLHSDLGDAIERWISDNSLTPAEIQRRYDEQPAVAAH